MKNMQSYNSSYMQRAYKLGLAAMVFFMGVLPMTAQDEVAQEEETEVVAKPKKQASAKLR